ncbi:MAG: rod shape-determining protein MreC [Gammaproteobacteria bacterium]|nr:rod shape-determining protein MreC [Gammaproteobacteria bacterium]MCP5136300.1 rod shape-determining protein MreC [Gammaproteobacteria bacterium]
MSGDTNSLFYRGPSALVRLVLLGLLSVVLMTADHRLNYLGSVRSALSLLLYPLQVVAAFPPTAWDWFNENMASRERLLEQNQTLRSSHLQLEVRMQRYAALEAENQRLREMLGSTTHVRGRMLVAELVSVDLDPYRHEVLINKGLGDDLFEGQPVLDARGVMGQVVHVGPLTSTVLMITDPSHALPVQVNRTGERTVAVGTGDLRLLRLPYLPNNADIREGDLLVTSGLGDRFPAGYPVGVISHISHDLGEPFARVDAQPTAFLGRVREALLVWPPESSKRLPPVAPPMEDAESGDLPIAAAETTPIAPVAEPSTHRGIEVPSQEIDEEGR